MYETPGHLKPQSHRAKMSRAKKILVMPDGNWLAHVSRPLEIAKVLRAMGHDVLFAGEGRYMQLPHEAGFKVLPIKTLDPRRTLQLARSGRGEFWDYEILKEHVEEELKLFGEVNPALVLCDFRFSLSTSCEQAGIPLAVILNAAWTNYETVRGWTSNPLPLTHQLSRRLSARVRWLRPLDLELGARPFWKIRRERRLGARWNTFDMWRGDLNLLPDIPEYCPTQNLPPNFHYIGPICWEPEIEPPAWLEKLDPGKPTIYITMGSTGNPRFLEEPIAIWADSEYQCLMTTADLVELPSVPENFFVVNYAPGTKLMGKSDVVICQGGNGTIYQAMAKGVPIVGIPTMPDQEFNMNRVEALGVGIHLSGLQFETSCLAEAVRKILSHKSYKENADKFKEVLSYYNGPRTGAELIDGYLN